MQWPVRLDQCSSHDGTAERSSRIDPRVTTARSRARQTSLALRAANIGDIRSLQHLYDDNADLSKGDYDNRTPMHLAAAEGHLEVVRFLLDNEISANHHDRWGGTPLDDAELGNHTDVIELLKQHGAEPGNSQHDDSESIATEQAAQYGDTDAVVELLWAAAENDIDNLRRCLAKGIPVSAADYDGRTALHLAASDGQVDAVKYLLAHDHPILVRDRWNATPLDDARRENRDDVVELLAAAEREFQQLTIKPDIGELARTNAFLNRYTTAHGVHSLVSDRVNVVLDEVLASIIDHASSDATCREIKLVFDATAELLKIVITSDGSEFDPLSSSETDVVDMEISGVAGKLIRKFTEDASYQRNEEKNKLSLTFRLTKPSAMDT